MRTIRNIMIWFLVLSIIGLLLTMGSVGYQIYLAQTGED